VRLLLSGRTIANVPETLTGDIDFYYGMAQLTDAGLYPYLHFWSEYPPLFPFLISGLYRLLSLVNLAGPDQFAVAYALVMSSVDLLNLVLVYRLVRRVHGDQAARWASITYAGCPSLVWFSAGWFDPLAVLMLLVGLEALLDKRAATAGVLIGLGVLTKVFPGVLVLAAPAALGWRRTARLAAVATAVVVAGLLPFVVLRSDLLLASLASVVTRGPWETLPAVLSGYYGWGQLPPLHERFSASSAFVGSSSPPLLTLLPEAVLLLGVWAAWFVWRSARATGADLCAVVALGVTTFALGNKGFSPQYGAWLIPMILLVWPNRTGLAYVVLWSAYFLAYDQILFPPIAEYYGRGRGSLEQVAVVAWVSATARTALIAWITGHLVWHIRASATSGSSRTAMPGG
jgi:4-amino-4-deoxy-L-arabinose transferase-like glycosyltransferase